MTDPRPDQGTAVRDLHRRSRRRRHRRGWKGRLRPEPSAVRVRADHRHLRRDQSAARLAADARSARPGELLDRRSSIRASPICSAIPATTARWTTRRTRNTWPAATSRPACACSTFATPTGRKRSPTTSRRHGRPRRPARRTRRSGATANRTADWASSNLHWHRHGDDLHLWFTSHENGFQIVKFTNGLARWPEEVPGLEDRTVAQAAARSPLGHGPFE